FETFQFGPEFSGLTRVVIEELEGPPGWSLDNLVFRPVPEPSSVALLGLGVGWLWRRRRQWRGKGG
ncbi:MAG: PEP-CTERM sorting domain-containing protein, partial [Verrucomicrobia bacterium]